MQQGQKYNYLWTKVPITTGMQNILYLGQLHCNRRMLIDLLVKYFIGSHYSSLNVTISHKNLTCVRCIKSLSLTNRETPYILLTSLIFYWLSLLVPKVTISQKNLSCVRYIKSLSLANRGTLYILLTSLIFHWFSL